MQYKWRLFFAFMAGSAELCAGNTNTYIDNIGESVPLLSLKQYRLYHSISTKIISESVPQLALNRYHF